MTTIAILDTSIAPLRCSYPRSNQYTRSATPKAADPIWDRAVEPKFKHPVRVNTKPPIGTAPSLAGLGSFFDRIEEINAIAKTQWQELPTITQELMATGSTPMPLDHAPTEEAEDNNISYEECNYTPYAFTRTNPEDAALLDRIEWERFQYQCGPVIAAYVAIRDDGTMTLKARDRKHTIDQIAPMAPRLKALGLEAETIQFNRQFAQHYGKLVLANMTPEQHKAWNSRTGEAKNYLAPASHETHDDWNAEDYQTPDGTGAPEELGFHSYLDDMPMVVLRKKRGQIWLGHYSWMEPTKRAPEPPEAELWPEPEMHASMSKPDPFDNDPRPDPISIAPEIVDLIA